MKQQIELVIFSSVNGRDGWQPVKPADVPEWVKGMENMRRLVNGETCMKCDEGPKGSLWYMGRPLDQARKILKAAAKRQRKAARRMETLH
jgi:hypothetical protein